MYIHVKARPGSKKEIIEKIDESHFIISLKEKAERGEANSRIIEILRAEFPKAKEIRIINGANSPSKLISVNLD